MTEPKPQRTIDERTYPQSVITVRLPKSMHDALKLEAHERFKSLNAWCILKLAAKSSEPVAVLTEDGEPT